MARARNRLSTPQVRRRYPPNPWLWTCIARRVARRVCTLEGLREGRVRLADLRSNQLEPCARAARATLTRCELASSAYELGLDEMAPGEVLRWSM